MHLQSILGRLSRAEPADVDIDSWYRRYGEAVYRRCLRLSRNEHKAWDITQEVFLRAYRYRKSFRGQSKPLSWLFTIADRCFFDTLREPVPVDLVQVKAFVRESEQSVDVVFARHELVAKLLSHVADDVREIVVYRFFDELEVEQIAERMGVNERTVRRKLQRFFAAARKLVA